MAAREQSKKHFKKNFYNKYMSLKEAMPRIFQIFYYYESFGDINQTELCMILCFFHSVKAFCI